LTRDQSLDALMATARAEFLRYGFDGTDVNRIARRSGVAPTSFYRWFKDKIDIFIAVYRRWEAEEQEAIQRLMARGGSLAALVEACVDHHRGHTLFRRSLRRLGHEDVRVRQALALSRRERLAALKLWMGEPQASDTDLAVDVLLFEGLAIVLAEADLGEMGLDDKAARRQLGAILGRWRAQPLRAANDLAAESRRGADLAWSDIEVRK
jgi:AcrR family transcriptional regulator